MPPSRCAAAVSVVDSRTTGSPAGLDLHFYFVHPFESSPRLARASCGGLHFLNQSVNLSSDLPCDSSILKYLGINCRRKDVNLVFGQSSEHLG